MNKNLIELNSEIGSKLGLTTDYFETAIVWNAIPKAIYIVWLGPKPGKAEAAYTQLLDQLDKIGTPVEFTAPSKTLIELARPHLYDLTVDPAGTPRLTNAASKFLV